MRTKNNSRVKKFCLSIIGFVLFSFSAFSQVDYEFWFAAPYATTDHAPFWPQEYPHKTGGRPIYLRLATQDADADVTVTLPALGITVENLHIDANSTATVDLTSHIGDIQCSKTGDEVENKGLYVRSNALITAYYEIASVLNTDIFSLKGQNGLGKEFYAPFQNKMVNDQFHNGEGVPDNGVSGDGAYSYIVIVATQDNTVINVTPTTECVGISKGTTKSVRLNRGQTYVVRAVNQDANGRMSGTHIKSTKPIAVTIGEDSAYPDYFTNTNDCEDYIGDQILPVNMTGTDYVIVQGQGYKSHAESQTDKGVDYYELVSITATKDGTIVYVDGAQYGSTLQKGETVTIELTDPNSIFTYIKTNEDHPVYAFHVSGYHCEVAGAILPSIQYCTGSYKMGFVRTYGSENDQEFYMNLMVKGNGEKDFLLNGSSNANIDNATFEEIGETGWKVARIYFSRGDLPEGAYFLQNTTSLFHMGMMNSTAHDWGDGQGYRLMGSMYGYFSRFSDNFPNAIIVNNNDTTITVPRGTKVSLLANGGYKFSWVGNSWDGYEWQPMESPYKLDQTNVENPYFIADVLGTFKYTATISTECYDDVDQDVYIRVVEPIDLNDIYDTVCYTPGLSLDKSQYYNLFNLNDTIVGKDGLVTGFYVDHFERAVGANTIIWDDFEDNRTVTLDPTYGNASISVETITETIIDGYEQQEVVTGTEIQIDPDTEEEIEVDIIEIVDVPITHDETRTVGHLVKTSQTQYSATQAPGIDDGTQQKSAWVTISFDKVVPIERMNKLEFDIKYDGTSTDWARDDHIIYVDIVEESGNSMMEEVATFPTVYNENGKPIEMEYEWKHVVVDFTAYAGSLSSVQSIRIRGYFGNWCKDFGYYLDNIEYSSNEYQDILSMEEAKHYTITDGDVFTAVVKNYFDVTRTDYAKVELTVRNPGIERRGVELSSACATEGNLLQEFNLTEYNYQMGGALVADRLWYWDSQKNKPVENPEYVDVPAGETTFYVYVDDECADVPGTLTVNVFAIPEVQDAEITVCGQQELGYTQGLVDLSDMKSKVTTDLGAKIDWYSDAAYTNKIGTLNRQVSDGTKFYAKVYNSLECPSLATLTVNVTELDVITFEGFKICQDAEDATLSATPTGGTYSGIGVTGNQFSPATAGVGTHEITYNIEKEGCPNAVKASVVVNPTVTVSAESSPAKIQQGKTATITTTVEPASSDYKYTWTPADKLENASVANPTTVALTEGTEYTVVVENTVTGCSASTDVLVDVYAPVKVTLETEPVCAGTDVLIKAKRTGGTGPYTFEWTLSPSVAYTNVSEGVIKVSNAQETFDVEVKVTDQTEHDDAKATATQVVNSKPSINLTDQEVCQHDALQLQPMVTGGTEPFTHEWSGDTDVLKTATNVKDVTVNTDDNTGTYHLTYKVTDENTCEDSKNITVTINSQPKVSATADPSVSCFGKIVQLTGKVDKGSTTGNVKHEWTSSVSSYVSKLSDATIPNPTIVSDVNGTMPFTYTFTDANGCSASADVSFIGYPNPKVSIKPIEPVCASEQGVQLTAIPDDIDGVDNAKLTYTWTSIDATLLNANSATPMLDINTPGEKRVNLEVKSENNCVATASTMVMVNKNPLAEIATKDIVTCSSGTVELKANASETGVSYKWEGTSLTWDKDNESTVNATIPANVNGAETIDYPVTLTVTNNATNCTAKDNTKITAHKIPQVSLGGDKEVCDGTELELKPVVNYVGTTNYTLTWFLDITQLSNVNIENPTYTQNGTKEYHIGVEVKDANNCIGKDEISIKGLENPRPFAGDDREAEWGEDFPLESTVERGKPEYKYLWSPKDSLTTSETLPNPTGNLKATTKFTLEVTDKNGCKGTDDVTITIVGQPLSVLIEQHPIPFCYGNTVVLEAIPSGGNKSNGVIGQYYRYEWYDVANPTEILGTSKTLEVSPTAQTTYKVVLSDVGPRPFAPAEHTHIVVVNPLPSISLRGGLNPNVCKGDNINLIPVISGGEEPYSYQWNDGSPIATRTENYQFSNSQTAGSQTLKLTVTDNIGCADSVDVVVQVNELPDINLEDVTECINVETTVVATASQGKAPYSYIWSGIQDMTSLSNAATFTLNTPGSYNVSVSVQDDNNCKSEKSAIVTMKPESDLALNKTYSVCAGEDLELVMNPNNISGFFTMHWVGGDRNRIVDSTKINRLISTFRSDNEGTYKLYYTIADENNCPRKDEVTITVFPAVKLANIPDTNACSSVGLPLEAVILAGTPSSFTWLGSVSPKNEQNTTFTFATPGTYDVTVIAGDQNCSDTKEFTVTVQPNPVVEIVGAPIKKVDYMSEVVLESRITNYTKAPFDHLWTAEENIKSGRAEDKITTKQIMQTTDYEYTIKDAYGCTASASIRLLTEVIIPKITRLCDGTEYTVPANTLIDASVVCLSDNALELCEGESAYLIPQFISGNNLESLSYSWKDDEGNLLGTDINVKVKPTKYLTTYTLTVSNQAGFSNDAAFTVFMHPTPVASITVSPDYGGKYYTNDVLTINGNPTPANNTYTSHWTVSPNVSIKDVNAQSTSISGITEEIKPLKLTYSAVDQYGCKTETSKEINIVEQKMPVIIGDEVCIYTTATYKLNESFPVGTKYVWSVTGGDIQSTSKDGSSISVYWNQTENTSITVSVYPPNGSDRVIEGITRPVYITPMPDVSINGQIHVCVGESAAYEAINNIPSMNVAYGWAIADKHGDLVEISTPNADIATALWNKEGKDTVILRSMYGACIVTDKLTVYIHPTPQADFTYKASEDVYFIDEDRLRHTDSIFVDKEVTFTNLTPHHTGYDYFWDFIGDGVYTENSRNAKYEYDESGDFMVSLMVVENTWGCKNVVAKPLKVVPNPNCGLVFPNAFTPDLAQDNTFYPVFKAGVMEKGYELRIYNRWGALLWTTTDLYEEWDGTYKGSISKQDVYVYHCKATCEDIDPATGKNRVLNVKGDVTIIR